MKHNILPPAVLDAPKKGFPTPLRHWFRGNLYKFIQDRLLGNDYISMLFDKKL